MRVRTGNMVRSDFGQPRAATRNAQLEPPVSTGLPETMRVAYGFSSRLFELIGSCEKGTIHKAISANAVFDDGNSWLVSRH